MNKIRTISPVMAWLTVFLLFVAYISSFVDRMILNLLVQPIKADLQISDTEFSLLQGLAFAVFYAFMGIPIGRILDEKSRMKIIALGIAIWSIMTALSGFAGRFSTLFLARIGVGVGEAALTPGAYSVITDSFPKEKLGVPMGIYNMGAAIGSGLAMLLGGYLIKYFTDMGGIDLGILGHLAPWQMTFVAVGLPGLLIALGAFFIPEPPRHDHGKAKIDTPSLKEVMVFWGEHKKTLLLHHASIAFTNFALIGCMAWVTAFYIRVHDLPIQDIGLGVGIVLLIAGPLGHIGGGFIADKIASNNPETGRLQVAVAGLIMAIPFTFSFPYVEDVTLSLFLFGGAMTSLSIPIGSAVAAMTQMTPNRMRSTISAIYILAVTIIGMTTGPLIVALLSDNIFTQPTGLRYSLMVAIPLACFLAALCMWRCQKHYKDSLSRQ